jgi:ribosomal protein S26
LRRNGSYIPSKIVTQHYCISCAVHTGKVQIRQASERRTVPERPRRY